jgi:hypothetical protein
MAEINGLLLSPRATERDEQPLTPTQPYSGFVGMYNFKGNIGKGHYAVVKLAEVSQPLVFPGLLRFFCQTGKAHPNFLLQICCRPLQADLLDQGGTVRMLLPHVLIDNATVACCCLPQHVITKDHVAVKIIEKVKLDKASPDLIFSFPTEATVLMWYHDKLIRTMRKD